MTSNDQGIKFGHQQNCQVGPHSPLFFFPIVNGAKKLKKMIMNHLLGESHHVTYVMEKKDKTRKHFPTVQVGAFWGTSFPPKKNNLWCAIISGHGRLAKYMC